MASAVSAVQRGERGAEGERGHAVAAAGLLSKIVAAIRIATMLHSNGGGGMAYGCVLIVNCV